MLNTLIATALAYLIGSLSFAVIVSWIFRMPDPHTYGSGNPGATNMLRTGNKIAALLTLLGDAAKGWLTVWLAQHYTQDFSLTINTLALASLAVFLGHLYPLFFRFKGGKGVATAFGVLLALDMWLGFAAALTWMIVVLISRYSSLGALVAATLSPFYAMLLGMADVRLMSIFIMAALLLWRHEQNIKKLLSGTETRLGHGKSKDQKAAATAGRPRQRSAKSR